MAVVGEVHYRDLDVQLELHKVVVLPPSDATETVAALIIAYPNLTYWTASSVGIVIHLPDDMEVGDWTEWYFVYGGINYYFFQYWIVDDDDSFRQFVFVEGRSPHFSTAQIALSDLDEFNSDAEAAAGGYILMDDYHAGPLHDRADYGSITRRLE
jgi:hypothetical protein